MRIEENGKRNRKAELFFAIIVLFYSFIMFILFYRQCIAYQGLYLSDMEAYILEAQGLDSGYSFPYPLLFLCARFFMLVFSPETAMAIAVTVLNSLSLVLLRYYLKEYAGRFFKERGYFRGQQAAEADGNAMPGAEPSFRWELLLSVLSLSLLFVSMLYAPRGHGFFGFDYIYRCSGSYTPNPFWNATYLATRPFSIVAFFSGVRMLDTYETRINRRDAVVFGVSMFLTTLTKPSYTLVAVVTFACIMLYRFVRSRFRNLKQSVLFGLLFLPTGLLLLYQYSGVFTGTNSMGEETGIGFGIAKAWSIYSGNIPLSIVMAAAFPIGVLIINLPRLKDTAWFRHGWQIWLTGFVMFLCLYEKGFRLSHMNFSWGYMHGLFFIFTVSVMMLLKNTLEAKSTLRKGIIALGWLGYLWHLGCGIVYFLYIYSGQNSGLF